MVSYYKKRMLRIKVNTSKYIMGDFMCDAFLRCEFCLFYDDCPITEDVTSCHRWSCTCPEKICKEKKGCYTNEEFEKLIERNIQ